MEHINFLTLFRKSVVELKEILEKENLTEQQKKIVKNLIAFKESKRNG